MAVLTKSKESVLEAGKFAFMSSVFHGLVGNFCLCLCVLVVTRHSLLTQLVLRMVITRAEFGSKQSHEIRPRTKYILPRAF